MKNKKINIVSIVAVLLIAATLSAISCKKDSLGITNNMSGKAQLTVSKGTGNPGPILEPDRKEVNMIGGCFCTEYVAYRIRGASNTFDFPDAKYWGSGGWLAKQGYVKQTFSTTQLPQNKDVIVIQSGWGVSTLHGHVAFVGSSYVSGSSICVNAIGANQGGTKALKCDCPNETSKLMTGILNNDSRIEIWRKANPALACP